MEEITELPTARTPWKTIVFGSLLLFSCGGYCAISVTEKTITAFQQWKDKFVYDAIVADLQTHPIEIDGRKKALPDSVKREDLLKMVFITNNRMRQCEFGMTMIQDTLNLNKEGSK